MVTLSPTKQRLFDFLAANPHCNGKEIRAFLYGPVRRSKRIIAAHITQLRPLIAPEYEIIGEPGRGGGYRMRKVK